MPATKWETLADHIRNQIKTAELRPGDKLPSTAQLKTEHGVSNGVIRYAMSAEPVRSALLILQAEGILEGHQGKGVFVTGPKPAGG